MVFTVMHPFSPGQQLLTACIVSDILPVHEHFSTDTPVALKSISISAIEDNNMLATRFITSAKIHKNVNMPKNLYL